MTISLESFLELPIEEVASLVKASGPIVCVFPINGTRRWYLLESNSNSDYMDLVMQRHVEVYRMLFDHGIDTLMAPMFGPDLMRREHAYVEMAMEGLARLTNHPMFLQLYQESGLRVRFYGDYRKALTSTSSTNVCNLFDQITDQTKENNRGRLFYGVFANDATETIAELSIRYYSEHGHVPSRQALLKMYYGENIGAARIFIGFDKFSAFDMPLIATDNTDLYFTASPSLYITERQLRAILYDHIYSRQAPELEYETLSPKAKVRMSNFYHANTETIFGLGTLHDGIWYPNLTDRVQPKLS